MRYVDFRHAIQVTLRRQPRGLTWAQLRSRLRLPHERPCPAWVKSLERDIGLTRGKGSGRAYVWMVRARPYSTP